MVFMGPLSFIAEFVEAARCTPRRANLGGTGTG